MLDLDCPKKVYIFDIDFLPTLRKVCVLFRIF